MTNLTDRDDAAHLAADLDAVRRAAAATDPRDYAADLVAKAFDDRPVPPDVRLNYLAGELEGALRELAVFKEAYDQSAQLVTARVARYLANTRGAHFRARVRQAAEALDAALGEMEGDADARP